ncbi:MAG: secondary thiamine-phosphate synthase enzyme YjbQ [Coriobacteriales bacterium]|jgi:secondary thiamine-phosphate synthase enzyme|nr:secondary thiamine-phosphate synthase enzyme YjbQ [Coriobacteriales bacterium]
MKYDYELKTPQEGCIDITMQVCEAIAISGVSNGIVVVYCPHTTAGMTINENADPSVVRDVLLGLERAFPDRAEFRHAEGNSAAHLKASSIGSSITAIIEDGRLILGTWQSVYFCEFDGPRSRRFYVKVIEG